MLTPASSDYENFHALGQGRKAVRISGGSAACP